MNRLIKVFFYVMLLFLSNSFSFARLTDNLIDHKRVVANVKMAYENQILTIKNPTKDSVNLNHGKLEFYYGGKISAVRSADRSLRFNSTIDMKDYSSLPNNEGNKYTIHLSDVKPGILGPNKSIQLAFDTDNKDVPHGFTLVSIPLVPVQVQVTALSPNWTQTIQVCNNSANPIPLTNVEFNFNYTIPMSASIWGQPWVNWSLASQVNNAVSLTGGSSSVSPLASDPTCTNPLTIQFSSTPQSPAPTGPFTFLVEGGTPVGSGTINVTEPSAPVAGLSNPVVTVQGMGNTYQATVSWGQSWSVPNLVPGAYTVTSSIVNNGQVFYTANPINLTVQDAVISQAPISYTAVATSPVTITLVNAPETQEFITFTGKVYSFNLTVASGAKVSVPLDTYTVASTQAGYSASVNPNPLVVPTANTLTITYQKQTATPLFVGYFQSWSTSWATTAAQTSIANMPSYVNVLNLSFMQPDASYQQGSLSLTGTGLQFNYASGQVLKEAIAALHQQNPGTKVIASVGGATYTNWAGLNAQAIANFVTDFGLDGVDIDFEPASPGCALGTDGLISCSIDPAFQSYVTALRTALPRPYWISVTGWSVGAYGEGQWTSATPASAYTGMMLPLLRSSAASSIDMVNVMSYDAGTTYTPSQALAAYSYYFSGPISMGVEVPPEAWGGHVYTIADVSQLTTQTVSNAASRGVVPGMLLWTLQKVPNGTPSTTNPSAQMMATAICTGLGLSNCSDPVINGA